MKLEQSATLLDKGVSRRSFLKMTSTLAAGTAFAGVFFRVDEAKAANFGNPVLLPTNPRVEIKYSTCQTCHGRCGFQCHIVDGIVTRLTGNPFHPCNREDHLPYDTDPATARTMPASLCAKSNAGMQSLYDPYRLKHPLKRVGPRGSGQWEVISWEQAWLEIGTKLNQYRDFTNLIDPAKPKLGKRVNQVVFSGGRNQQSYFTDMWFKKVFGTVNNRHDHTSICEVSHHIAHELWTGWGSAAPFLTSGYKNHSKPDLAHAKFHIQFGADFCSANFSFVPIARKTVDFVQRQGRDKLYVVDPRCSIMASKGTWVPIKMGTDAALGLAIGRIMVDNGWYRRSFLERPHDGAANPTGELSVSDATLLVKIDNGRPAKFLRTKDAEVANNSDTEFVVWQNGAAVRFNSVDTAELLPGEVTVHGYRCKTAFQLYVERVREKTVTEYSALCGVPVATIQKMAAELWAAGRRGSVGLYRGAVQHTNGVYTARAILNLNMLLGNVNWKGGLTFGGGGWSPTSGPFGDPTAPSTGVSDSGTQITRIKAVYEESDEYADKVSRGVNPYPTRRPWFPLAGHYNFQEIIPSIDDEYPYPVKALILYWWASNYNTPAEKPNYERVLKAQNPDGSYKLELVVGIDIAIGEAMELCDYVLPDTMYLEKWTMRDVPPIIMTKTTWIRQPVVGTVDPVTGDYTPVFPNTKTLEDILIGLARTMGWPTPYRNAWDFWRRLVGNAVNTLTIPGNPTATMDDKINYALARGGRFENADQAHVGEALRHKFSGRLYFFSEKLAKTKDSMTGQYFDGMGKYEPIMDVMGNLIEPLDKAQYPLQLTTYKLPWHYQANGIRYPWMVSILPENFVEINAADAAARNIRTGDLVRLASASAPEGVVGRAKLTHTIMPGVVAVSHHFGHWAMSSKPFKINGQNTPYDPSRAGGITANPIMRADPHLKNVTLQDKIGASASYYDTYVQVTKV